jgi:hypothetical protein
MSTEKQKAVARKNLAKARKARTAKSSRAQTAKKATKKTAKKTAKKATRSRALSTAKRNDLPATAFAFPKERKEPLVDARHVRNAIARFDQVEGVSDAERDRAWKRILRAAKRFDIEVSEASWRELFAGGKARKR